MKTIKIPIVFGATQVNRVPYFSQFRYDRIYADCQAGGMNETESHELAMEHAHKQHKEAQRID